MAIESVPATFPRKPRHLAALFPQAIDGAGGIDPRIALNACLYRAAATLKLAADDEASSSNATDAIDGAIGYIELAQSLLDDLAPAHGSKAGGSQA